MFSPDVSFFLSTFIGLGYLFLYVVASAHLEDVVSKPLPFFAAKQIAQENIGIALRFFHGLPTYYALTEEFKTLGLHRDSVTEASVLAAFERIRDRMESNPWAYPRSQHDALIHLTVNARVLAKCAEMCKKYNREFNRDEFEGALI